MSPPMNPWQQGIREDRQQRERGDWWNRIMPPDGPDYYPSSPWLPQGIEPPFEGPGRMIDAYRLGEQSLDGPPVPPHSCVLVLPALSLLHVSSAYIDKNPRVFASIRSMSCAPAIVGAAAASGSMRPTGPRSGST
jgi:hypothetical protein